MSQDVGHNFSIVACFILHAFGRGAISKIEIAGKFCGPCEVRLDNPQAVILDSQLVSLLEPLVIFVARGLLRTVDAQNHRSQEGRLGPREVIGAVGVQDSAVMLDLEQKIVDHVPGKIEPAIEKKSHDDEVAVPSVNFIKHYAGDNVTFHKLKIAEKLD